jgi:ParB family chromosome partitioning protein
MTVKKRAGLGRGLSALLDEVRMTPATSQTVVPSADAVADMRGMQMLPISKIVANPQQPRRRFDEKQLEDLINSVRERGIIQPILVRPLSDDRYEIVAGERRWRAAQAAQLHEVPVVVRTLDDSTGFEIALVENVQRADLNAIEEAAGYRRLMVDFHHTQEVLSKLVGKSRSHIANLLRLLELPQAVRDLVVTGDLSMGHARTLVGVANVEQLARKVVAEGLSVRALEKLVREGETPAGKKTGTGKSAGTGSSANDADIRELERQLESALGLKAKISFQVNGSGQLSLSYSSLDQLDMLCQKLTGGSF